MAARQGGRSGGHSAIIEPIETVRECHDAKDDKYLALPVAGRADVIVSSDACHLLLLPRIPAAPHKGESDDAERSGEHDIEARRKAVAGHGDEPSRDKGCEAAEDRHGDGEAQ